MNLEIHVLVVQIFASRFTRSREAISWQPSISVWTPERRKGGQVASKIGDRRSQGREFFALQIHELQRFDREKGLALVGREVTCEKGLAEES